MESKALIRTQSKEEKKKKKKTAISLQNKHSFHPYFLPYLFITAQRGRGTYRHPNEGDWWIHYFKNEDEMASNIEFDFENVH